MQSQEALVLDDHQLFAEAFAGLLKSTNQFAKVTSTNEFVQLETLLKTSKVSHLFIDYMMPNVNTLVEIKKIRMKFTALQIIVVSSILNPNLVMQLKNAGANGFISKNSNVHEIENCMRSINGGRFFMSADLRDEMIDYQLNNKKDIFTEREYEIFHHIVNGDSIDKTADKLNLSKHTVVAHRRNMMEKMEVNSVSAMIKKGIEMGLIS
jgi:two-component system, NarL family, response regulator FusR